jgi:probable lipoprotein NlpC
MRNWAKYINIPFKDLGRSFSGVDCYGLLALIYENELGIVLPDYTELVYNSRCDLKTKNDHILKSIGINWVQTDSKLKEFDALLFNRRCDTRITSHIGLYAGNGKFLHVLEDFPSMLERLDNPLWKSKFYGAMRWQK